jgi:hypothetical protein
LALILPASGYLSLNYAQTLASVNIAK